MSVSTKPPASFNDRHHLHVVTTHFPVSFFGIAFFFQILHLFSHSGCFELATNITLAFAAASMIPTTLTGWLTWRNKYKAAHTMTFNRKITIAIIMAVFGTGLVVWRFTVFSVTQDYPQPAWHWLYLAGSALLILGAVTEGYYGGRLNHG